ncbi:unnamed protein product [Urochloa humidicola]
MADKQASEKWTLPDTVAKTRTDDGECIGPLRYLWPSHMTYEMNYLRPKQIHLGLFSDDDERQESHHVKISHLHSLVRRRQDSGQDAAEFTRYLLFRFKALEEEIKLQHRPEEDLLKKWGKPEMLEELLLDAAFIVEQLLQNWEAGTRPTKVMRSVRLYRNDLVLFSYQIPYVLLLELIQMVNLKAGSNNHESRDVFLKRIAIGYIVAEEASEWLLTKYEGPVRHLLHLVHLHLASKVVERQPAHAEPRRRRRSLWECCQALRRAHVPAAEPLGDAWWSHSKIPPARDLYRVGIRLRPPPEMEKATRCLADVRFRNRVLELQPLDLTGFDFQLLVNLVALELEWGWESGRRLFLSYTVFISELMPSERDSDLLQTAGVLIGGQDGVVKLKRRKIGANVVQDLMSSWFLFNELAEANDGSELHPHFIHLARQLSTSYGHLNRTTVFARSSCFSG